MRMGGNTGIERIVLYALCVITLFATWPMPVMANPPVGVMARLITGLIGRRALTMEAEKMAEGVYVASLERATRRVWHKWQRTIPCGFVGSDMGQYGGVYRDDVFV